MSRRTAVWVAAVALVAAGCGSQPPSAADQVPRLGTLLDRIDADLVSHQYGAARDDLRALKAAVAQARRTGQLRDSDAVRVLDAAAQLLTQLPEASSGPTATAPSPTASPSPSKSPSSHPTRSSSTTPTASPTTTAPSTSPSAAPTSSPSAPATSSTAQVSPAAASVTPSP